MLKAPVYCWQSFSGNDVSWGCQVQLFSNTFLIIIRLSEIDKLLIKNYNYFNGFLNFMLKNWRYYGRRDCGSYERGMGQ